MLRTLFVKRFKRILAERSTWKRYGVSVVAVTVSALLTATLHPFLKEHSTYLPFTLAVMGAAWYGGLWPGLMATVLSFLTASYFFIEPIHTIWPIQFTDIARLALFGVVGVSISLLTDRLARATNRLSVAVEATGVGIFVWHVPQGRILLTPEAERLYGLEPGTFLGTFQDFMDRIHRDDAGRVERELREAFSRRLSDLVQEFRVVRPDGAVRWIEAKSHMFYSAAGVVTRVTGTNVDVTERRNREQEREALIQSEKAARIEAEQARNALTTSNQDLQRFAYAVSHDLQQPLRSIGTHVQLLVRRNEAKLDDESREIAAVVVNSVQQIQKLIASILKYSSVSHGGPPAKVPSDANFVLNLALQHLRSAIEENRAEVTADPLPTVMADHEQLLQVFLNLLGNAIKYRRSATPRVHVSVKRDSGMCCFSVSDNGIGIDPQYHERIFGFFQKLHSSAEYEGVGIGLALVKRIVERHGGRVWVESEPDAGSTFYFTMPAKGEIMGGDPLAGRLKSAQISSS